MKTPWMLLGALIAGTTPLALAQASTGALGSTTETNSSAAVSGTITGKVLGVGTSSITVADDSLGGATTITKIVPITPGTTYVKIGVPGAKLADIKVGDRVKISTTGSGTSLSGTRVEVVPAPDTTASFGSTGAGSGPSTGTMPGSGTEKK